MLSGKFPFYAEHNYEIFQKIETENPNFWKLNVSENAIDFMKNCLIKNPKKDQVQKIVYNILG